MTFCLPQRLPKRPLKPSFLVLMAAATALRSLPAVAQTAIGGELAVAARISRKLAQDSAVRQAAYALAVAAVADADGYVLAPRPVVGTTLTGGGLVPATSGAPTTEGYGVKLGYCAWDNGTSTAAAGYLPGANSLAAVTLAVVSPGSDNAFATTCAQIAAGTAAAGDDFYLAFTAGQILAGVQGTAFFADPVATLGDLSLIAAGALQDGQVRLVKATNQLYRYRTAGAVWEPVSRWQNSAVAGDINYTGGSVSIGKPTAQRRLTVESTAVPVGLASTGQYNGIDLLDAATSTVNAFFGYDSATDRVVLQGVKAGSVLVLSAPAGVQSSGPLAVSGLLTASGGISATSGAFSAGITSTTGAFSALLQANGGLAATSGSFSGALAANGGLTSTTGAFSGLLAANGGLAATTGTFSDLLVAGGGLASTSADFSGEVRAGAFVGPLVGNATTATKLAVARTINGVAFDGSQNITVADATKLPLAGGTLTGALSGTAATFSGAVTAATFNGPLVGNVTGAASLNVLKTGDTMTGALTSPVFIPSSATIPVNGMFLPAANTVGFATASTVGLRIDSGQRVLVGLASSLSSAPLQVQATSSSAFAATFIARASDEVVQLNFKESSGANDLARIVASPSGLSFTSGSAGTERMRIDTDGNVGIGTATTAGARLRIITPSAMSQPVLTLAGNSSAQSTSDLYITRTSSNSTVGGAPSIQLHDLSTGAANLIQSSGGAMQFFVKPAAGSWQEAMRIDSSGSANFTGVVTAGGFVGPLTGNVTGAASLNVLKTGDTMTGALTSPAFIPNSATIPVNGMFLPAANTVGFATASTERMRIDSTGRMVLGIVATPLQDSKLNVADHIGIYRAGGLGGHLLLRSSYGTVDAPTPAGAGQRVGRVSGAGYGTDGKFTPSSFVDFFAAETPTATAGGSSMSFGTTPLGSITPVEAMRIEPTGNVLVGFKSEPQLAGRFNVADHIAIYRAGGGSTMPHLVFRGSLGTIESPLPLGANANMGRVSGNSYGTDGTYAPSATMDFLTSEVPTATGRGGHIVLRTTPNGALNPLERMRIDSEGNVGIGSAAAIPVNTRVLIDRLGSSPLPALSAGTVLTLAGSGAAGSQSLLQLVSGNAGIGGLDFGDTDAAFRGAIRYDHANDGFAFYTAGTQKLTLTAAGAMSVTGAVTAPKFAGGDGTVAAPSYSFTSAQTTGMWSPSANAIAWSTAGAERMRIDTDGNVAIGTTATAGARFRINSPSAMSQPVLNLSGNSSAQSTSDLYITRTSSSTAVGSAPSIHLQDLATGAANLIQSSGGALQVFVRPAAAGVWQEAMRIDSAGSANVSGVVTAGGFAGPLTGNVTGSASLNVLKTGDTMTGALTIAPTVGNEAIRGVGTNTFIAGYNAANNVRTGFLQFNATSNVALRAEGSNNLLLQTASTGVLSMHTNNVEAMRIEANGNVGIGVAASAS